MMMAFLFLPTEIRLKIFSELLVLSKPIVFTVHYSYLLPFMFQSKGYGLYPVLLRLNKQIYREASPILYSNNCFQFPSDLIWAPSAKERAHIASFLQQIGSRASLIRHIRITFCAFDEFSHERRGVYRAHTENLAIIRDTCTHVATLELLFPLYRLSISPDTTEALGLINTQFKTISSLKGITINFQVCSSEDVTDWTKEMMCDLGWAVQITLPREVRNGVFTLAKFNDGNDGEVCFVYKKHNLFENIN